MSNPNTLSLSFLILLILHINCFSLTTSNITAVSKDQIQCTMCAACDNPCQPLPSPPPPPPVSTCPPPPSQPPPAVVSDCPPPPSMPSSGTYYYSPPPPPPTPNSVPTYAYSSPPPPADVGEFYPPPNYGNYPAPPPPNPILPYFPFYYRNPPPSSVSNSVLLKMRPTVSSLFLFLSIILCCFL